MESGLLKAPVGDTHKRQALARLRERYVEARELVSLTEPYANLEWILGAQRSQDRDESVLAPGVAELVVLWMQDLATELENSPAPARPGGAIPAPEPREALTQALRIVTQEFALAFQEGTE